jgi:hypothetical protein
MKTKSIPVCPAFRPSRGFHEEFKRLPEISVKIGLP